MTKFIELLNKLNIITFAYADKVNIENQPLNLSSSQVPSLKSGFSFVFIIIVSLIILVALIAMYLYVSKKSLSDSQNMGQYLKILERKRLGRDSFIYIIKLNETGIVVAENSSGINTLLTIEDTELLKEIEINTMNKFENISFENLLKKESYRISNLKKK